MSHLGRGCDGAGPCSSLPACCSPSLLPSPILCGRAGEAQAGLGGSYLGSSHDPGWERGLQRWEEDALPPQVCSTSVPAPVGGCLGSSSSLPPSNPVLFCASDP